MDMELPLLTFLSLLCTWRLWLCLGSRHSMSYPVDLVGACCSGAS